MQEYVFWTMYTFTLGVLNKGHGLTLNWAAA